MRIWRPSRKCGQAWMPSWRRWLRRTPTRQHFSRARNTDKRRPLTLRGGFGQPIVVRDQCCSSKTLPATNCRDRTSWQRVVRLRTVPNTCAGPPRFNSRVEVMENGTSAHGEGRRAGRGWTTTLPAAAIGVNRCPEPPWLSDPSLSSGSFIGPTQRGLAGRANTQNASLPLECNTRDHGLSIERISAPRFHIADIQQSAEIRDRRLRMCDSNRC